MNVCTHMWMPCTLTMSNETSDSAALGGSEFCISVTYMYVTSMSHTCTYRYIKTQVFTSTNQGTHTLLQMPSAETKGMSYIICLSSTNCRSPEIAQM